MYIDLLFLQSVASDILRNPCEADLQGLCKCAPPLHAVTWLRHNVEFNFMPLSVSFISMHKSPRAVGDGMSCLGTNLSTIGGEEMGTIHFGEERMEGGGLMRG